MKTLKLEIIKSKEIHAKNKYYLYYGGGRFYFTSKRKASDFVVLLSDTLRDSLNAFCQIQSKIYSLHLDYYIETPSEYCRRLKYYFDNFIKRLDFIFKSFGDGNSSLIFSNFNTVMSNLESSIIVFNEFAKKRKNYHLVNLLNSNLKTFSLISDNYDRIIKTSIIDKSYKTKKISIVHKNTFLMTS